MYKYLGLGLMSVFAMMVVPGNFDISQGELSHYGAGTITLHDSEGSELFTQTIHNRLVDTGETFMLEATFQEATAPADNVQIGSICISNAATPSSGEGLTAGTFDTENTLTEANCKEDTVVALAAGVATVNPATFTCNEINCTDGDTITAFAVCQNDATDDADFLNCGTEGILFAVIDNTDTVLNAGETLDITYNFDISSATT